MAKRKAVREKVFVGESSVAIPRLRGAFLVEENFPEEGGLFTFVDSDLLKSCGKAVSARAGYALSSFTVPEGMTVDEVRVRVRGAMPIDMAAIHNLISSQPRGGRIGALSVMPEGNIFVFSKMRVELQWESPGWKIYIFEGMVPHENMNLPGTRFFYRKPA